MKTNMVKITMGIFLLGATGTLASYPEAEAAAIAKYGSAYPQDASFLFKTPASEMAQDSSTHLTKDFSGIRRDLADDLDSVRTERVQPKVSARHPSTLELQQDIHDLKSINTVLEKKCAELEAAVLLSKKKFSDEKSHLNSVINDLCAANQVIQKRALDEKTAHKKEKDELLAKLAAYENKQ
jgi:hypothetical protein